MRVIALIVLTVITLETVSSRRIRQKATKIAVNWNLATPYFESCQCLPFPPDYLSPFDTECQPCLDEFENCDCEPFLPFFMPQTENSDRYQILPYPPPFESCKCQPFPPFYPFFDNYDCRCQKSPPNCPCFDKDCQCQQLPPNCASRELILPPLKPELPNGLGYLPGAVPLVQSYLEKYDRCGRRECVGRCRVPVCESCLAIAAPLCAEMAPMPRPIVL